MQVVCVSPPVIVFGPRLTKKNSEVSDLELRFLLARAAELARPGRIIASGHTAEDFKNLMESMWRVFGDDDAEPEEVDDQQHEQDERFRKTLPVAARATLEGLMNDLPKTAHQQFRSICQNAADRAGLLICGDIDTALRHSPVMQEQPQSTHLLKMPLMPGYTEARQKLGVGSPK